ncbi:MAG: hypothetical protein IKJ60_10320 [Ruminococcus sp.]|nr:hypothetical protein [Ruminococcus sp.]
MTLQITEMSLFLAENKASILVVVLVSVILFIASTVFFGFISYRTKLRQLKNSSESSDNEDKQPDVE